MHISPKMVLTVDKEKICHDLSVEFAKSLSFEEDPSQKIMSRFEYNERLLCHYAWCFDDLMRNFDSILERYQALRNESS